jgi:uncharacterized membrane protein YdjX (TVP38/TMEM64 family)
MKDTLIQLFHQNPDVAILISLCLSILVALSGLIPSVFITTANILFFGFWKGTVISFAGEAAGAVIAFVLYRKGFKRMAVARLERFPRLKSLVETDNRQAWMLIFSLRLIPFVPSGLVTFAAAIGKVSLATFTIASSAGKIPALLIEAYSAWQLTRFQWQGKLILAIIAVVLLFMAVRRTYFKKV